MTTFIHALKVRNFQSLHQVDVELGGFTVIVGPSSSGKSAFTRALRTLVSNRRGTEWITTGERVASISAQTAHGTVTLKRSRNSSSADNCYTLTSADDPTDTKVYSKLGGETPEDVSKFLGINAGSSSTQSINFAGQFDKPYLLDDSAADVARTLGALTNVSVIFDAARESNRQKLAHSQTLKVRSQDLEGVKERVPEFQALKGQATALEAAESRIELARSLERDIARISHALGLVETLEPTLPRLEAVSALVVPDENAAVRALEALRSFRKAVGRVPDLAGAVRASEAAYRAVEEQEDILLLQLKSLNEELTQDVRTFVEGRINRMFVLPHDTGTYVELGHVVDIFTQFLESKAAS